MVRAGTRVLSWGQTTHSARLLEYLEGAPPLPGLPEGTPTGVTIWLAPSEDVLTTLAGGTLPEWGAAFAFPETSTILLPAFATPRTRGWDEARVLRHEWAHVALGQYLADLRIPRWFQEGYAEWASGGWDVGQVWKLRVALAFGRAAPLDSLSLGWPADRASAEVAYLLSGSAVEYLVSASGERGLEVFLERWRETGRYEESLRRTFGVTTGQFEEDWRKYVKKRYGWLLVLTHSAVVWMVMALASGGLALLRRRRDRERLASLRAADPPDLPEFWFAEAELPQPPQNVSTPPPGESPPPG